MELKCCLMGPGKKLCCAFQRKCVFQINFVQTCVVVEFKVNESTLYLKCLYIETHPKQGCVLIGYLINWLIIKLLNAMTRGFQEPNPVYSLMVHYSPIQFPKQHYRTQLLQIMRLSSTCMCVRCICKFISCFICNKRLEIT